jgi:hypothetical protein
MCIRRLIGVAAVTMLCALAAATSSATAHRAACSPGGVAATAGGHATCLRAGGACKAAFAGAYKRHGFACRNGRLRRTVPEAPPPPPPPPPPAKPGHYEVAGGYLRFDVLPDGATIANFFARALLGCQPAGAIRLSIPVTVTSSVTIQADKSFSIDFPTPTGPKAELFATGSFDATGATASGTFEIKSSIDLTVGHYDCDSGPIQWTATLTS